MSPPGQDMSNILLGKSRGLLVIIPERKKQLDQSGNNTQLWMCLVVKVKSFSRVRLFGIPWTVVHQVPLSMGFSRQRILEWVAMLSSRVFS